MSFSEAGAALAAAPATLMALTEEFPPTPGGGLGWGKCLDLPVRSIMAKRPGWPSLALAIALHAAFAAAFMAITAAAPDMPQEPAIEMELVEWAPPQPAPVEQTPASAKPSPPTPAPAKTAAPRPTPTPAPAKPTAITPTATQSAPTAPAEIAGDNTAATPAPTAGAAPQGGAPGGTAAGEESYVPPSGDAAYLSNPKPAYPSLAQRRGWEGVVTLSVAVDETGAPQEVRVKESSGYSVLDRCAVEAVQRWRFVPARRAGRTVAAHVEVPVRFGLSDPATG